MWYFWGTRSILWKAQQGRRGQIKKVYKKIGVCVKHLTVKTILVLSRAEVK